MFQNNACSQFINFPIIKNIIIKQATRLITSRVVNTAFYIKVSNTYSSQRGMGLRLVLSNNGSIPLPSAFMA